MTEKSYCMLELVDENFRFIGTSIQPPERWGKEMRGRLLRTNKNSILAVLFSQYEYDDFKYTKLEDSISIKEIDIAQEYLACCSTTFAYLPKKLKDIVINILLKREVTCVKCGKIKTKDSILSPGKNMFYPMCKQCRSTIFLKNRNKSNSEESSVNEEKEAKIDTEIVKKFEPIQISLANLDMNNVYIDKDEIYLSTSPTVYSDLQFIIDFSGEGYNCENKKKWLNISMSDEFLSAIYKLEQHFDLASCIKYNKETQDAIVSSSILTDCICIYKNKPIKTASLADRNYTAKLTIKILLDKKKLSFVITNFSVESLE